jgi:GH15 family glucan-1,4-alpha-glucosidase
MLSPETGLHKAAFDLWETFRGTFTYSNGAIAAALAEAAGLAEAVGEERLAEQWLAASHALKDTIVRKLWQGDRFARGLTLTGEYDNTVDASILGLITPFKVLRLEDPEERELAQRILEIIEEKLCVPAYGGRALLRFEHDNYAGGGPSAVATIWHAQALLTLGATSGVEAETAQSYRTRAEECLRTVLRSGTATGLLPEMMGAEPGGHWAVPHAWACLLLSGEASSSKDNQRD